MIEATEREVRAVEASYELVYERMLTYRGRLRRQLLDNVYDMKSLRGSTLSEVGEYYGFDFVSGRFCVLVCNFIDRLTGASMRKKHAMERAAALLEQSLLPRFPEGVLSVTDDLLLCLLNLEGERPDPAYLEESFQGLLADELLKGFHCIMGVGAPCGDVFALRESFDSAVGATQHGILYGYDKWYTAAETVSSHWKSVPISPRHLSALQTALSSRSETMLAAWVREVFADSAGLFRQDPTYAYLLPRNIAQKAHALAAGMTGAEIIAHAGDVLEPCVSLEQEQQVLIDVFSRFCAADRREINPAVVIVQSHLQLHFHEAVTLDALGRLIQLNPQYLSVLFRQETGETISDYIRRLRLSAAQELLRTTSMSVAQVADTVGYRDPQYFSRVFQKTLRQSPRQYRNGEK